LLAALLIAHGSPGREMPRMYVHEWGVMTYGECQTEMSNVPPTYSAAAVRAPVVYFHGPEFTGTFSVEVGEGYLTDLYPAPDSGGYDRAVWTDLRGFYEQSRSPIARKAIRDLPSEFEEYLDSWRSVQSLVLSRGSDFSDRFLYYECVLGDSLLDLDRWVAPVRYEDGELLLRPLVPGLSEDGEVLVIMREGGERGYLKCPESRLETEISFDDLRPYSTEEVMRVLFEWNDEDIDFEEIVALWRTWEEFLTGPVGERETSAHGAAVIGRMDPEKLDQLCHLELITEEGYTVEYRRFVLSVLLLDQLSPAMRMVADETEDLR
jgi:hypothetical protein